MTKRPEFITLELTAKDFEKKLDEFSNKLYDPVLYKLTKFMDKHVKDNFRRARIMIGFDPNENSRRIVTMWDLYMNGKPFNAEKLVRSVSHIISYNDIHIIVL